MFLTAKDGLPKLEVVRKLEHKVHSFPNPLDQPGYLGKPYLNRRPPRAVPLHPRGYGACFHDRIAPQVVRLRSGTLVRSQI